VATNSFGTRAGSAPPPPPDSDFIPALTNAIARGVKVFFSAGNYHLLAGGQPTHCNPTSIWLHKCREDVLTIANCQLDGAIWEDSSRGPGQHHGESGASVKPDVAAPTPLNGRVVYLDAVQTVSRWGTSGACPQAAGLAALLLAQRPELTYQQLFGIIRGTATTLPQAALHCVGQGLINCQAAFDAL
jgi:serine protease AprX